MLNDAPRSWSRLVVCGLLLSTAAAEASSNIVARIALLSDTHTLAVTNNKQAAYRAHFVQAVAEVNAAKVDLVLIGGDLTDHGKAEEMEEFQQEIRQFNAPVWFVAGNHDVGNKLGADRPPAVTAERIAAFEKRLGPSFFERTRAGVRVLGINSCLFGSGLPQELQMWSFLESRLVNTNPHPTIILSHYPPFTKSADEAAEYYNVGPEARRRLLGLVRQGRVRAVLTGHLHRPLVKHLDGCLLVTTPPVSFGLPAGKQDPGWTLLTLTGSGKLDYEFKWLKK